MEMTSAPAKLGFWQVVRKIFAIPLLYVLSFLLMMSQLLGDWMSGKIYQLLPSAIRAGDVWRTAWMYLPFLGIWMGICLYMLIFPWNRPIFRTFGREPKGNTGKMFALGLLLGLGMNGFVGAVALLRGDIRLHYDSFPLLGLLLVFVTVFIQSSAEELLDRAFLYQRLRCVYRSPWVAILASSLFFALLHLFNPGVTVLSLLNIFLVGVFYALMVYYFDSLWFCFAHHTAWNFTQNMLLGLPNSGLVVPLSVFKLDSARDSFAYNTAFGIEGTVLATVVLLAGCAVVIALGRRRTEKSLFIWENKST